METKKFCYFTFESFDNKIIEAGNIEEAKEKLSSLPFSNFIEGIIAEFIEEYKGVIIANWDGVIIVINNDTRYVISLDDSKNCGYKVSSEEYNNIESAKKYIDSILERKSS